jgi:hypothetical protein
MAWLFHWQKRLIRLGKFTDLSGRLEPRLPPSPVARRREARIHATMGGLPLR